MINFLGCSAQGVAIFSGALTLALLQHLVEREIISRSAVLIVGRSDGVTPGMKSLTGYSSPGNGTGENLHDDS